MHAMMQANPKSDSPEFTSSCREDGNLHCRCKEALLGGGASIVRREFLMLGVVQVYSEYKSV